jgi:putative transposase
LTILGLFTGTAHAKCKRLEAAYDDLVWPENRIVWLPPRSPNLNAHAERFVRSIKESCLERLILFGEPSLRTAVQNFVAHYHLERNHQGLGNRLIQPEPDHAANTGAVQHRERLGGRLNYYYRAAA